MLLTADRLDLNEASRRFAGHLRKRSRQVGFFFLSKASEAKVVCFMGIVQFMTKVFYRL